jgi:DNA-binding transcriptional regulator YdaS (Cro superfamily)
MHPMLISNNVKIAINRAGGPTKVALLLGCSGTAVHAWIRKNKISDINKATKLAQITGMQVRELRPCR